MESYPFHLLKVWTSPTNIKEALGERFKMGGLGRDSQMKFFWAV